MSTTLALIAVLAWTAWGFLVLHRLWRHDTAIQKLNKNLPGLFEQMQGWHPERLAQGQADFRFIPTTCLMGVRRGGDEDVCATCVRLAGLNGAPCSLRQEFLQGLPEDTKVFLCPLQASMVSMVVDGRTRDRPPGYQG